MPVRPLVHEAIRGVVMARMALDGLQHAVIAEMTAGYRPTYRGHEWTQETFDDLEAAIAAVETAFHYLKAVQFPETRASREADAMKLLTAPRPD